ncbi:hypothetical protein PVAND_001702 [Polypedilum vanderplanki]|uniref:Protein PET117 homolog, mitochondrial n=1 Tax=Polypedilum vanderplanki TaxID=319348 RepID=A0A9J6BNR2_POLVA|nr:hypothetical protein PVAND_001702 [Polypedilum vanderplanki]
MSLASKITFVGCCAATVYIIGFVHYQQSTDRQKLKEGIYRDIERQALRKEMGKTINQYNLQQQKELEKILRKEEAAAVAAQSTSNIQAN